MQCFVMQLGAMQSHAIQCSASNQPALYSLYLVFSRLWSVDGVNFYYRLEEREPLRQKRGLKGKENLPNYQAQKSKMTRMIVQKKITKISEKLPSLAIRLQQIPSLVH